MSNQYNPKDDDYTGPPRTLIKTRPIEKLLPPLRPVFRSRNGNGYELTATESGERVTLHVKHLTSAWESTQTYVTQELFALVDWLKAGPHEKPPWSGGAF